MPNKKDEVQVIKKKPRGGNSPVIGDNGLMLDEGEIWKPIIGYEGLYEISNLGRIKSIAHRVVNPCVSGNGNTRLVPEKIRKPNVMKGYYQMSLAKNGTYKVFKVHRLVMAHFGDVAPSPEYQINHIDGDKANNSISNLEWVTAKQNTHHAFANGLRQATLSEETRRKISNASKKMWEDEKYREKQCNNTKEMWERRKEQGWTSWKTWEKN